MGLSVLIFTFAHEMNSNFSHEWDYETRINKYDSAQSSLIHLLEKKPCTPCNTFLKALRGQHHMEKPCKFPGMLETGWTSSVSECSVSKPTWLTGWKQFLQFRFYCYSWCSFDLHLIPVSLNWFHLHRKRKMLFIVSSLSCNKSSPLLVCLNFINLHCS